MMLIVELCALLEEREREKKESKTGILDCCRLYSKLIRCVVLC